MTDCKNKNAETVLKEVERLCAFGGSFDIRMVYDRLSIFDWWSETLSNAKLKQMRSFLKAAIARGYTGYVCFKVGASGCANGMWAYKKPSTDGYSPDGEALYRSFSPDYTYWSACVGNNEWLPARDEYDSCKTVKALDAFMQKRALQKDSAVL